MDMVKTRVQDLTTSGGEQEANPLECLKGILKQEGWRALFTGGWARVARSAPQFGVTLLVYDSLNSWLNGVL
jgi:solute carrier family 25 aspartate/glutamate transporter 12/13